MSEVSIPTNSKVSGLTEPKHGRVLTLDLTSIMKTMVKTENWLKFSSIILWNSKGAFLRSKGIMNHS